MESSSGQQRIVVQAVLLAFCVMACRLTTGEHRAQENFTVALLPALDRGAFRKQEHT